MEKLLSPLVKTILQIKGLSQSDLAKKLNTHKQHINALLSDGGSDFPYLRFLKIAEEYGFQVRIAIVPKTDEAKEETEKSIREIVEKVVDIVKKTN